MRLVKACFCLVLVFFNFLGFVFVGNNLEGDILGGRVVDCRNNL